MGSLKNVQSPIGSIDPITSSRISFSADYLDDKNFISISLKQEKKEKQTENNADFEFLSNSLLCNESMLPTADELFLDGKLLPFWQMQEKLNKININQQIGKKEDKVNNKLEEAKISWFLDDDPSPRPPKCTVLWKELLRLKKQRGSSTLSPSSSSSSSSPSSGSISDKSYEGGKGAVRRLKKGLERSR